MLHPFSYLPGKCGAIHDLIPRTETNQIADLLATRGRRKEEGFSGRFSRPPIFRAPAPASPPQAQGLPLMIHNLCSRWRWDALRSRLVPVAERLSSPHQSAFVLSFSSSGEREIAPHRVGLNFELTTAADSRTAVYRHLSLDFYRTAATQAIPSSCTARRTAVTVSLFHAPPYHQDLAAAAVSMP